MYFLVNFIDDLLGFIWVFIEFLLGFNL